jgi:hypothetical protein
MENFTFCKQEFFRAIKTQKPDVTEITNESKYWHLMCSLFFSQKNFLSSLLDYNVHDKLSMVYLIGNSFEWKKNWHEQEKVGWIRKEYQMKIWCVNKIDDHETDWKW